MADVEFVEISNNRNVEVKYAWFVLGALGQVLQHGYISFVFCEENVWAIDFIYYMSSDLTTVHDFSTDKLESFYATLEDCKGAFSKVFE